MKFLFFILYSQNEKPAEALGFHWDGKSKNYKLPSAIKAWIVAADHEYIYLIDVEGDMKCIAHICSKYIYPLHEYKSENT